MHKIDVHQFPNVERWGEEVAQRPTVQRDLAILVDNIKVGNPTDEVYQNIFGRNQFIE